MPEASNRLLEWSLEKIVFNKGGLNRYSFFTSDSDPRSYEATAVVASYSNYKDYFHFIVINFLYLQC